MILGILTRLVLLDVFQGARGMQTVELGYINTFMSLLFIHLKPLKPHPSTSHRTPRQLSADSWYLKQTFSKQKKYTVKIETKTSEKQQPRNIGSPSKQNNTNVFLKRIKSEEKYVNCCLQTSSSGIWWIQMGKEVSPAVIHSHSKEGATGRKPLQMTFF